MAKQAFRLSDIVYRNFHSVFILVYILLLCRATVSCYRIVDFEYTIILMLFAAGILLYLVYSLLAAKALLRPALVFLALSALVPLFMHEQLAPLWEHHILQNYNSINLGIYNETETYFQQFLPFLIFIIPLVTAIASVLCSKGRGELTIVVFTVFMFSFWNNGLDRLLSKHIPWFIFLSLVYFSLCKYHSIAGKPADKAIKVDVTFRNIFIYTIATALAFTFLSAYMIKIFGSRSIVQLRSEYAIDEALMTDSSRKAVFDLSNTGYGGSGRGLGGPVRLDTLAAIRIKADHPSYLRGSIKDFYDGQSWSKSAEEYSVLGMNSLTVPDPDFNRLMSGKTEKKPVIEKMSIFHYGIATSTIFSPPNTISVNAKDGKVMYDSFKTLMLMGKSTISEPYTIKYYRSSTGIESFTAAEGAEYMIDYEIGSQNIESTYKAFLQIPESVSPRTRKLVQQLVSGCRTPGERVKRIMNHLKNYYPYSLQVSMVPENTDFVDYFLFSERKGYCTYFASAATIMFRLAGIPARYVEGFNMDDEKDTAGFYIVRNYRAHAWPEILVASKADLWSIADCVPQGAQPEDLENSGEYRDRFDSDRYKKGDGKYSDASGEGYGSNYLKYYGSLLSLFFYPMLAIPAVLLLFALVYTAYRLLIHKRLTNRILKEASCIPYYRHVAQRLKVAGEAIPEERCELEYVRSMKDRKLSEQLEKIVEACYSEFYGGLEASTLLDKKACNRIMEKHLRRKMGFLRYWYCIICKNKIE